MVIVIGTFAWEGSRRARRRVAVPFVDRVPNRADTGAGVEHLHRRLRDVEADLAADAVLRPGRDLAARIAPLDETVVIAAMPARAALAAAETGHVVEHLGMPCGELVDRLDHRLGLACADQAER